MARDVWAWLPAFRVVAETEHLPSAAARLHVSASALSRTIRRIEDELGLPLFRRVGRNIRLTAEGIDLLSSVQKALRDVADATERGRGLVLSGKASLAAPTSLMAAVVVPALARVVSAYPMLVPELDSAPDAALERGLSSGSYDLVVTTSPLPAADVARVRLCTITHRVYAGRRHPLYAKAKPSLRDVLRHPFVGPPDGGDGWPRSAPRDLRVVVSFMTTGLDVCLEGTCLAFLPDVVARRHVARRDLRELVSPTAVTSELSAFHARTPSARGQRLVSEMLSAIRAELAETTRRPRRARA